MSDSHPLRRVRTAQGLSLRRLAERAKVHYIRIHYIEHGLEPREDELLRLAAVLRCTPESLCQAHVAPAAVPV